MHRPRDPSSFKSYLIDIEGVLVRDKRYVPIEGSVDWYNGLAARGIAPCLVSNNTTHRPEEVIGMLRAAGFAAEPGQIVTALAIGTELLARWGRKRLLWLGAPRLAGWWEEHGFALAGAGDPGDAAGAACDAVVLGVNPELTVADLDRAIAPLLDHQAELVALHRNLFWLDDRGERRLGPGAWCAALEDLAGREAVTVGKPKERIYREALKRVGGAPEEALFISDDPPADLVTARRLGMGTAFVLCGKYTDHAVLGRMAQDDWPDLIVDRPANIASGGAGGG